MKILLMGWGRFYTETTEYIVSQFPENYAKDIPGYDVITFGYNNGVDIKIKPEDDLQKVIDRLPPGWTPDYCIMYNLTQYLLPQGIERAPFPTVYMALDWDVDAPAARTHAQSVDLEIVGGEYAKDNVMACANNIEILHDSSIMQEFICSDPLPIKNREYDIVYTSYIDRVAGLDPLRFRYILKLCDLANQYKYKILIAPYFPNYETYLLVLQNSKMAFSHNRDGHMSFRVLEAGSQGTVVLDTSEQTKKYFEPNKEYIPVTEDDFFQQVRRYLEDETTLQEMSDRFHTKVTERYESRKHFTRVVGLAERILKNKTPTRRYSTLPEHEKHVRRGETLYFAHYACARGGNIRHQENKFLQLSIEEFKKALVIESTPRAMTDLAVVIASLSDSLTNANLLVEKILESISILEQVISSNPFYAIAWFNLGLMHYRIGNKDKALDVLNKALAKFRDKDCFVDPWCLHSSEREEDSYSFQLGRILDVNLWLLIRGEEDRANEKIRKLYQAAALYYISLLEEDIGNFHKALALLDECLNLYPGSHRVVLRTAQLAAILGFEEKSLVMYKQAKELRPLDFYTRIEYIRVLHLYKMEKEVVKEISDAVKVTKTVAVLQGKAVELQELLEKMGRTNSDLGQTHDSCKELLLFSWVECLYNCLRKKSEDLRVVLRITDIWDELGRIDKIFDIVENYVDKYLKKPGIDQAALSTMHHICAVLEKMCDSKARENRLRLKGLKELMETCQNGKGNGRAPKVEILA